MAMARGNEMGTAHCSRRRARVTHKNSVEAMASTKVGSRIRFLAAVLNEYRKAQQKCAYNRKETRFVSKSIK